jgi:hypothetical protein
MFIWTMQSNLNRDGVPPTAPDRGQPVQAHTDKKQEFDLKALLFPKHHLELSRVTAGLRSFYPGNSIHCVYPTAFQTNAQ